MWISKRNSLLLTSLNKIYSSTQTPVSPKESARINSSSVFVPGGLPKPERSDSSDISGDSFEEKKKLFHFSNDILHKNSDRSPRVAPGTDTGISDIEDVILIFSNFYFSENPIGNIGVIRPRFVPDPDTISQVDRVSNYYSKILSKNLMEV
jgi:hypothetical protein